MVPTNVSLRMFSRSDTGAADAINYGFSHSTGDVLAWIGCDDEYTHGALDYVMDFFDQHPENQWLIGSCQRLNDNEILELVQPSLKSMSRITLINSIDQPSSFWRRSVFEKVGYLDESYRYAFDWDYWCRFKTFGIRPSITTNTLSKYWFSQNNLTSTGTLDQLDEQLKVINKYNSERLSRHFKNRFTKYDLPGYYGKKVSLKEKIGHQLFIFNGIITCGYGARFYSLYWLANQIRSQKENFPKNYNLLIVTAANSQYFVSVLSLLSSLKWPLDEKKQSLKIHIWDLGLSERELSLLTTINLDIEIKRLSDHFEEPFPNAFIPDNDCFAWKSFCIFHSFSNSSRSVLWIDAGAAVTKSLSQIIELINSNKMFLLESEQIKIGDFMTNKAQELLAVTKEELESMEIITTVVGFSRDERVKNLILDWVKLSSNPDAILGDWNEYRHDQTLMSILARRQNFATCPTSKFGLENFYDLKSAYKKGATFIFHRRNWTYVDLNSLIDIWHLTPEKELDNPQL